MVVNMMKPTGYVFLENHKGNLLCPSFLNRNKMYCPRCRKNHVHLITNILNLYDEFMKYKNIKLMTYYNFWEYFIFIGYENHHEIRLFFPKNYTYIDKDNFTSIVEQFLKDERKNIKRGYPSFDLRYSNCFFELKK